jgi:hypothetical protein
MMSSGPRPEMRYRKHPWQKLTLKSAWFRSFGPFLESIVYLHWPKACNPILNTSVDMLFWISSKTIADRAAEKHWRIFSCILRRHQLKIRDFLQKRLNPQKPKECRIHPIAQTQHQMTSFSLFLWNENSAGHRSLRATIQLLR